MKFSALEIFPCTVLDDMIASCDYQVVQAARDHYDCPTLAGPLLENEGGELSRGLDYRVISCIFIISVSI